MDLIGVGQELRKVAPCSGCYDASLTLDCFGDRKQRYRLLCLGSESSVSLTDLHPTLFI